MHQIDDDDNQAAPYIQYVIGQNVITISDDDDVVLTLCKWRVTKDGYAKGSINGKPVLMHRLIMERILGRTIHIGFVVDHINGNRSDNRRENLREVDTATNNRNRAKPLQDYNFKGQKIDKSEHSNLIPFNPKEKPKPIKQDTKPVHQEIEIVPELRLLEPDNSPKNVDSPVNDEPENIITVTRNGKEERYTIEQLEKVALFFIENKTPKYKIIRSIWSLTYREGHKLWRKLGLPDIY